MFLAEILDLIAPLCCLGCYQRMDNGTIIYPRRNSLRNSTVNICAECTQQFQFPFWPSSQYENTWTLCAYQGVARQLINRIKEGADESLWQFLLEKIIFHVLALLEDLTGSFAPVAVIPAPTRRRQHMMDIPYRLSAAICAQSPDKYTMYPILRLERHARDSAGLTKWEREKNIAEHLYFTHAADTIQRALHDSYIIMLDDVITSGTTMNMVKRALKQCGISLDAVLTICHA